MPDLHPLLGTNDRNQAHDPVFQAAQVADRQAAEGVAVEDTDDAPQEPAEAVEGDDDGEPDPIETPAAKRARHEKPDSEPG